MPSVEDALMEQIKEKFISDLLECFEEVFYELAGESMELAIAKDVYAKYRPSQSPRGYDRRKFNGGLIAHENYNSFCSEFFISSRLLPGKSVLPIEPQNSVSPVNITFPHT